jgi:hypothetical protein
MSAVGIGLAWAAIAMAAFLALSASALLARTRHELEVAPRVAAGAQTRAQWPAVEVAPASVALRRSPSAAHMQATIGRLDPVLLS